VLNKRAKLLSQTEAAHSRIIRDEKQVQPTACAGVYYSLFSERTLTPPMPRTSSLIAPVLMIALIVAQAAGQPRTAVQTALQTGSASSGMPAGLRWWTSMRPVVDDERLNSDVAFLESILTSAGSSSILRAGAADRLVRDRSPEGTQAIDRALRSGEIAVVAAAIEALDRAVARVPGLTDALIVVVTSDLAIDRAAAARVLAASDARAADLLTTAARNSKTTSERVGAIEALGAFRTRDALARLIAMLDERREPADIIQAICTALDRATGAGHGADPAAWRAWWEQTSRTPVDGAGNDGVNGNGARRAGTVDSQLQARAEAAERAAADERRRAEQLGTRLTDVYGQLFLHLTQKERFARSVELLTDPLTDVRAFGVTQFERMLRNGERPDEATLRATTILLDDPVPSMRVRGVKLLDELAVPDLAQRLAERLPKERDADVAAAYLSALANRPASTTFPVVLPLLRDPVLGEAACRVLNRLVDSKTMPSDGSAKILPALREAIATRPNGPAAQLLAWSGDDTDLQTVTAMLDASDSKIRRGAAEGLRRRGVRRPLYERAGDPAIYSPLVAALAEEPKTLATLEQIVAAVPPPDLVADWNAALGRVLRDLPFADLLAADRLLAPLGGCDPKTRLIGLSRFAAGSASNGAAAPGGGSGAGITRADVDSGLRRYIDVCLATDRTNEAIALLKGIEATPGQPAHDALFRLYALMGEFRRAAELKETAGAWLVLLESIGNTSRAGPIADEFAMRFAVDDPSSPLTAAERENFLKLRRALPAGSPAPGTATAPAES